MRFGPVDESSIVLSMKAPKKAPTKPPRFAVALVPFDNISDAHAAVCSSDLESSGLKDVEISWAGGKEPDVLKISKTHSTDTPFTFASNTEFASSPPKSPFFAPSFVCDHWSFI